VGLPLAELGGTLLGKSVGLVKRATKAADTVETGRVNAQKPLQNASGNPGDTVAGTGISQALSKEAAAQASETVIFVKTAELFDKNGQLIAKQNPLTGEYEAVFPKTLLQPELPFAENAANLAKNQLVADGANRTTVGSEAASRYQFQRLKADLAQQELLGAIPTGSALKGSGPFSPRTFGQSIDLSHASPTFARDLVAEGQHFTIQGGDGVFRNLTQVPGQVNSQKGVFEFIVGPEGLTHQRFIPDGQITGYPNQKVTPR